MKANISGIPYAARIHPLVATAYGSIVVLCLVGVGTITGLVPNAYSQKGSEYAASTGGAARVRADPCASCGVVESMRTIELRGDASGIGAVTGGVTGAVLGNSMGRGRGNTAMTIIGAAGGALAGNEIEKSMKKRYAYRVTVRMDDGSIRTLSQSTPTAFAVGAKVRLVDGTLVGVVNKQGAKS